MAVGGPERRRQLLVGAAHLRRRLGVVAHAVGEVGDLAARLGDRLALLGGEQRRELLGVLLDQRGGLGEDRARAVSTSVAAHAGNARLAVATASSTSAAWALGTVPTTSSVAGLTTSISSLGGGLPPLPSDQHGCFHGVVLLSGGSSGSGGAGSGTCPRRSRVQRCAAPDSALRSRDGTPAASIAGRDGLRARPRPCPRRPARRRRRRRAGRRSRPSRSARRPRPRSPRGSRRGRR